VPTAAAAVTVEVQVGGVCSGPATGGVDVHVTVGVPLPYIDVVDDAVIRIGVDVAGVTIGGVATFVDVVLVGHPEAEVQPGPLQ
jgi:hypothetical protein